ncbi:MAG: cytochrome c [Chloroflexi bacterium]|nr:cytochrome c [Chloroflexota bacterium]
MSRFLVPAAGFVVVIGIATFLIGKIVLNSPDTHAHLWETLRPEYDRTAPITVGQEVGDVELALTRGRSEIGNPMSVTPGQEIYLASGCSLCHGLDALGGPVGPSLAGTTLSTLEKMVRDGPGGMPAYGEAHVSDSDLAKLADHFRNLPVVEPNSAEIAAIQRLTWDPAISPSVLLQGKAAVRRSCGACHTQPTAEEIRGAFGSDFDATSLVADMATRQTNLSLEDARAIAYYMMAVLHGVDLVKER